MTRILGPVRYKPGTLCPAPRVTEQFTLNHRGRPIPNVPPLTPFYCFAMNGNAVRNGHRITKPGWYYVDKENALHGPFGWKREAEMEIGEASSV